MDERIEGELVTQIVKVVRLPVGFVMWLIILVIYFMSAVLVGMLEVVVGMVV